nr:MAG TPA: hypothetical protein [Bacteriophage sp.]
MLPVLRPVQHPFPALFPGFRVPAFVFRPFFQFFYQLQGVGIDALIPCAAVFPGFQLGGDFIIDCQFYFLLVILRRPCYNSGASLCGALPACFPTATGGAFCLR